MDSRQKRIPDRNKTGQNESNNKLLDSQRNNDSNSMHNWHSISNNNQATQEWGQGKNGYERHYKEAGGSRIAAGRRY